MANPEDPHPRRPDRLAALARLTVDRPNASSTAAAVPKTTRVPTSTTRPFSRRFVTTA
jgi:hypothetical protein